MQHPLLPDNTQASTRLGGYVGLLPPRSPICFYLGLLFEAQQVNSNSNKQLQATTTTTNNNNNIIAFSLAETNNKISSAHQ